MRVVGNQEVIRTEALSHPGVSLEKHVDSLGTYYRNFSSVGTEIDPRGVIEAILYHDWGKQNRFFQERMEKIAKGMYAVRDSRRDKHAVLSAMKYMVDAVREDGTFLRNLNIVLGHHGQLRSFDGLMDMMYGYVEDRDLVESFCTVENITESELRERYFELDDVWYTLQEDWTIKDATRIRKEFSQLVDADRLSAMRGSAFRRSDVEEMSFNREAMMYTKALGFRNTDRMDRLRREIKLDDARLMSSEWGTFTLTLPTGLGKTIAAARIAEKAKGKVIYVVPYLSVADQTWEVFSDMYKHRNGIGDWEFLAKHDSRLNEGEYGVDETDETISVRDMITSWRSKIVITTSVQFFDSLVSVTAKRLRKMHNTYGATILIDEPQAIPYEKWEFLKKVVESYAKELRWKVIYVSATPPTMLPGVIPLVKNEKYLFSKLSRTRIEYLGSRVGYQGITDWANDAWEKTRDKDQVLWLLNVEKMARKVFEKAVKMEGMSDRKVVFVSGKLPPIVRMFKIRKLKELMARGEKVLVISTQVLEAGVDLDFDGVVRDLAPFPVLIQVAGRLNRKWKRDTETLYVMQMVENTVYSDFEFRHTGHVLYQRDNAIDESEYYEACKEYYALCEEMPPIDTPSEWMDQYVKLLDPTMQMIESPDYQASALCKSINQWERYGYFNAALRDEFMDFMVFFEETTGYDYEDVLTVAVRVLQLRERLGKGEDVFDELTYWTRYLAWFETTCSLSEISKLPLYGEAFYPVMDVPVELLTFS